MSHTIMGMLDRWTREHGDWIKNRVQAAGFNQVSLAKLIKVHRVTLNRWLQSSHPFNSSRAALPLKRLASILRFKSPEALFEAADAHVRNFSEIDPASLSSFAHDALNRVTLTGALDLAEIPLQYEAALRAGLEECAHRGLISVQTIGQRRIAYEPRFALQAALCKRGGASGAISARLRLSEDCIRRLCDELGEHICASAVGRYTLAPRKYDLVIFDWSNTLVHETAFDDKLCDHLSDGQRALLREHLDKLQSSGDALWYDYRHLATFCGKPWESVVDFHNDPENSRLLNWISGARYLLNFCRKRSACALATNSTREVLDIRLKIFGLEASEFASIATSDVTKNVLNKRDHYGFVLDETAISPASTLVISDNLESDVLPAVRMGIDAIWFYYKTGYSFWGSPSFSAPTNEVRLLSPSLKPSHIAVELDEIIGWLNGSMT